MKAIGRPGWRLIAIVGLLVLAVGVLALPGFAAVNTWGPLRRGHSGTDRYYWTDNARSSDVEWTGTFWATHSIYQSDHDPVSNTYPPPYCQVDPPTTPECPYRTGVFYERSLVAGTTWAFKKRLNPDEQYGQRVALTADGTNVYTAWTSVSSYYDTKVGSGPRVLYFRMNTNLGATAYWLEARRMTSVKGRVDFPSLAAAAGRVYLAWTNSNTGRVFVARSTDNGATWTKAKVGTTEANPGNYTYGRQGLLGMPSVATSDDGMIVGLIWLTTRTGEAYASTSNDGGATWTKPRRMARNDADSNHGMPNADGGVGRVGFVWQGLGRGFYREFEPSSGGWSPRRTWFNMDDTMVPAHHNVESANIDLNGADKVGLAYGGCLSNKSWCQIYGDAAEGVDLLFIESEDSGATWSPAQVVQAASKPSYVTNDDPTVTYESTNPGSVHVLWNTFTSDGFYYEVLYKKGTTV